MINAAAVKYAPAVVAPVAIYDWHMAAGIALGFISGWMARTAAKINNREAMSEIQRDLMVSVLIAGGSLIVVLYIVRLLGLDELGAAGVAFLLSWGGIKLLDTIGEDVKAWFRRRFLPPDGKDGE